MCVMEKFYLCNPQTATVIGHDENELSTGECSLKEWKDVANTQEWGLTAVIDAETGINARTGNTTTFTFDYNSGLTNPSIHFKMYRRDYSNETSTDYDLVDAAEYFSTSLTYTNNEHEYLIINSPTDGCRFTFTTKEDLVSGTYKMEFILYSGTSVIGSVEKYIIIR